MSTAAILEMHAVQARHGELLVLNDIDLRVHQGEFVCVLGPTGCGKSTLLDLAAGLKSASAGRISSLGEPLRGLNRHAGYLFQHDALLPWASALDNVSLPLRVRAMPRREAEQQALRWLGLIGLTAFARHYPAQLSGGMRKRVALAQALIHDAPLLLMDEPFAALDAQTRQSMQQLLRRLCQERGKSVLFVTHDLDEALTLADRILVFSAGPASRCVEVVDVTLPGPRNALSIRDDLAWAELYRRLWHALDRVIPHDQ